MIKKIESFLDAGLSNINLLSINLSGILSFAISPISESINASLNNFHTVAILMTINIVFGLLSFKKKKESFSFKKLRNSIILIGVMFLFIVMTHRIDQLNTIESFSIMNWFTWVVCIAYFIGALLNVGHAFDIKFLIRLANLLNNKVKEKTDIDVKELMEDNDDNK